MLSGSRWGEIVHIPRIKLNHEGNNHIHIPFTQFQFPIVSAFFMTIKKSQGQSLLKVGVLLPVPCFSHGQLYLALSRCTSLSNIWVSLGSLTLTNQTTNIVCWEILQVTSDHWSPTQSVLAFLPSHLTVTDGLAFWKSLRTCFPSSWGPSWDRSLLPTFFTFAPNLVFIFIYSLRPISFNVHILDGLQPLFLFSLSSLLSLCYGCLVFLN